ncbi:hypothetical protein A9K75_09160 [Campylobacter fetus subsp. testudinum]|uniref:hypothetical protein n=1 Tax=Campylobacter fetus TaxID=196 RepID=UPI000818C752|nr:hypothetical protein [Campylobacter fetus]OCR98952.1 hypothetical protein A9K75_09160 [Campylobacter fetus subsp. testudinum]
MDELNKFEILVKKYGQYNPNNPETILNEKINQRRYRKVNLDEEKRYYPDQNTEEISNKSVEYNETFDDKKFAKYFKCMQTILLKSIEKQLLNTEDFNFPKAFSIIQNVAHINRIFLKTNSIYKKNLNKNFNQETLKIRSAFKSLLSNLEKFQYKELNVKTNSHVENRIRSTFPKAELYRFLRLFWINRKLEKRSMGVELLPMKIGYGLIEDILKSCIPFYPNLIYYFDDTKEIAMESIIILERQK